MAVTYTWAVTEISTTNTSELQEVVVKTMWTKTGTDDAGNSGVFVGATPFTASSVTPGTFVPFNELTQEIVLSWIQSIVVGEYEIHVNKQIDNDIAAKKLAEQPLPWAPPKPPQPEPPVA
jgi:hypothetical protein